MVQRRCRSILRNEEDAMDATQEVFAHLIRSGETMHDRFPSSLLWRMATNECLNRIRGKHVDAGGDALDAVADIASDRGFEAVEVAMTLDQLLAAETEESRSLLYMYHVDTMTLAEIASVLHLSISGVRKRLMTIEARLRNKRF
jgi:RNA polymerase sigma-70 factor (ECF subfamily)